MVDLLQLSQRIGVQIAAAGEQVQLAQKLGRLIGEQLSANVVGFDLSPQTGTTSSTSGIEARNRSSMPIFSVISEEGQPLQEPRMCR